MDDGVDINFRLLRHVSTGWSLPLLIGVPMTSSLLASSYVFGGLGENPIEGFEDPAMHLVTCFSGCVIGLVGVLLNRLSVKINLDDFPPYRHTFFTFAVEWYGLWLAMAGALNAFDV